LTRLLLFPLRKLWSTPVLCYEVGSRIPGLCGTVYRVCENSAVAGNARCPVGNGACLDRRSASIRSASSYSKNDQARALLSLIALVATGNTFTTAEIHRHRSVSCFVVPASGSAAPRAALMPPLDTPSGTKQALNCPLLRTDRNRHG